MSEPPVMPAPASYCVPVDWACAGEGFLEGLDEGVQAKAEALAGATLWALTAHQVGGCPIDLRPCAKGCGQASSYMEAPVLPGTASALGARVGPWWAHIEQGQWVNTTCGCTTDCSCSVVPEVRLPAPGFVHEVRLDGEVLDGTAWRVDDGTRLVRIDGGDWPKCQDMAAAPDAAGSFVVSWSAGSGPDGLVAWAAGLLAVEYAKACMGQSCGLPDGVTSVTRQGVSWEISTSIFDEGLTGIREVDAVVRIYNPYGLRTPPSVWTPKSRTRTTTQYGVVVES
jgi:hypothetical protein